MGEKRRKEQKEKEEKQNRGPRCHRVPQQHCHSVPVSTPSRNCHHVASRPVCSVSHVEKRVKHCNPIQVHHPETICRKVPNQVCHQEPAQSCRKVRPQPQQRTQEVCKYCANPGGVQVIVQLLFQMASLEVTLWFGRVCKNWCNLRFSIGQSECTTTLKTLNNGNKNT